jgi:glycerophosphoryl diester phosphodiesterase
MAFLRIGHRGAAGTRPELTIPAFTRALDLGVDLIELDVQLTRDRQLVVLHDRQLGRTVRGEGPVRERSLAELMALDAGAWFDARWAGAGVPSLEQVVELTRGRAELNVEIKSPPSDWEGTAEALLALLTRHGRLPTTIISGFEHDALQAVRTRSVAARIGVLWQHADLEPMWCAAAALGAMAVHPHWGLIDEAVVVEAHQRGLQVLAWTVNDPDAMAELARLGVDGLISDFPERLRAVGGGRSA